MDSDQAAFILNLALKFLNFQQIANSSNFLVFGQGLMAQQNLKWLEIRYKHIKQSIKYSLDVSIGLQSLPLKNSIISWINCAKEGINMSPVEF